VNLHEQLDDLFEAISPTPAPIEAIMKRGSRIRWRRRVVTATGIAAVVAAAIGVPLTVRWQASPAPATSHYTVTVQAPGQDAPADEIAYGTVNGKAWRILMISPMPATRGYGYFSVEALGPASELENRQRWAGPVPLLAASRLARASPLPRA
jgi:hypothetical protein